MKQEPTTETKLSVGVTESLVINITSEMVHQFARLTGDLSSLHTDSSFGRRSMYRDSVAHGMLPVMLLTKLQMLQAEHFTASLESLNARFLKPVFIGDQLVLNAEVVSIESTASRAEISFTIQNATSDVRVTAGSMAVIFRRQPTGLISGDSEAYISESIVTDTLIENHLTLQGISREDTVNFGFRLLPLHAAELNSLLQLGLESINIDERSITILNSDLRNFLAASLLSTSIGMCRPGRFATFLEFSIFFDNDVDWSVPYTLNSTVRFISVSTQTVVEKVSILEDKEEGQVKANGKMKVRVNEPPRQMPSLEALRENGMDFQLKDKVVLITGASGGIGETTAKLFSLHGARVVVNYFRGKEAAEQIVGEINADGGKAIAACADVSDCLQVKEMIRLVNRCFGPVDVLVNNAVNNFTAVDFLDLTWDIVDKDINVIVKGAFNCCQAVIPSMIENGGGRIVNVLTLATDVPPPGHAKYVVAKSGLIGLSRSLAVEFAPHNIQVNMVSPSFVETDLTSGVPAMFREKMKNETPMMRNASSVDVAKSIIYLASSLSSFSTGQRVLVTGGHPPYV